jgi:predicted Zn-dependent peptidase
MALGLEDTRGVSSFFGYEQLMLGKVRTPEEVYENLNKVTVEDVYVSARKIFNKENIKMSIIGPFKEKTKFEKLL